MENLLQILSSGIFGKNDSRQFFASKAAIRANDVSAEAGNDLLESRRAGLDNFPCQVVGIKDRDATGLKNSGGGGFAHSDAASKAKQDHWTTETRNVNAMPR